MQLPKHIICFSLIILFFFFEGCYTQLSVQKRVVVAEQPFRSNETDFDDQEYILDSDTIIVEEGESVTIINNYSSLSLNPYYNDHWGFDPFYNVNFYYRPYGGFHYPYWHRPIWANYGYAFWYDPYFYDPGYFCYSGYYGGQNGYWYSYPYSNWYGSSSYYSHYEKKKRDWDRRRGDIERQPVVRPAAPSAGKLDNVVVSAGENNNLAHVVRQPVPSKNIVSQKDGTRVRKYRKSKNNGKVHRIIVRKGDRKEIKYQKKETKKNVVKRAGSNPEKKKYRKNKSRSYAHKIIRSVLSEVVSAASHPSVSKSQSNRKKTSKESRYTKRSSKKSNRRSR